MITRLLLIALLLLVFTVPAFAKNISTCRGFQWDLNTEVDLAGYKLYVTQDTIPTTPTAINNDTILEITDPDQPFITCAAAGLTPNHVYTVHVTALDFSNNESLPSDVLSFTWTVGDSVPPGAPSTPRVSGNKHCVALPLELCVVQ